LIAHGTALAVIEELGENISFERVQTTFSGYGLGEILRRYEKDVIKQALVKAEGSVTRAARLLGVSHQRLIYIINGRHRELLYVRTPATRRHTSIIKR
jgi:transcriptional regulator with PAS, ATPase and Fis domain